MMWYSRRAKTVLYIHMYNVLQQKKRAMPEWADPHPTLSEKFNLKIGNRISTPSEKFLVQLQALDFFQRIEQESLAAEDNKRPGTMQ